ncbi:MAG: glycoside hydrolase family 3 C-terminal domain-containing protein [Saccharofermentans sp.]|nr:glycoside hydrolase family 3 C-terminal domain-containing protein [Saccharofermentans sp.]
MKKEIRKLLATTLAMTMVFSMASCAAKEATPDESEAETTAQQVTETEATTVPETEAQETEAPVDTPEPTPTINPDYIGATPEEIVAGMSLKDKASQMVQGALYNLNYKQMTRNDYGSVLSTNSNWPANTPEEWIDIVNRYQVSALNSSNGIPYIYGQDSVHGVNTASGTVIFPHNINIGAANDPDLTREYGVCVGSDLQYTGMIWNFAPCVAASQDPRWGRTYESYSSDLDIITSLSVAYVQGLQSEGIVVCPKHFICDGYVKYGTGESNEWIQRIIDRGDAIVSNSVIEDNLAVYQALIDEGAQTIMISHSALNGIKMHENGDYIWLLKNEMGFEGFIVSDWDSLENCSGETLYDNVVICVNAGVDMLMEASNFEECRDIIVEAVNNGDISMERVDDAVTRIIRVKMEAGLFEDPYFEHVSPSYEYNSDYGIEVATKLAEESLVPLKTDAGLTLEPGSRVFVMGPAADDVGALCGGWTVTWEGLTDEEAGAKYIAGADSILDALVAGAADHDITIVTDPAEMDTCDVIVLALGETTYAEWNGDTEDLSITGELAMPGNAAAIAEAAKSGIPTITLLVAGRNVIISDYIDQWDSVIMCYLPGSQGGDAIANALFGECDYQGTLPMPYYQKVSDIESGKVWLPVGFSAVQE